MIFEIHAEKNKDDKKIFFYDNEKNTLSDDTGYIYEYSEEKQQDKKSIEYIPFSKDLPLKKRRLAKLVKIQLGLSCNYSCDYCSQKFVERPKETNSKDIENFMKLFNELDFSEELGLKIEFWGGEPFVYWKTLKPLAEALREKFSTWGTPPHFSVITNGSLLTEDICAWLYAMGFSVSISHDGPGQFLRGPDPFDDPEKRRAILDLYETLKPIGRISFNAMLASKNISRKDIHAWFIKFTGDPDVQLGEGGFVDAYDQDGIDNSLETKQDHFAFRRTAFNDIFSTDGYIGFNGILGKIDAFTNDILKHNEAKYLNQKCGMDDESTISIDLRGNVITCQNTSAIEVSNNGESHLGGNLADFDNVELRSATHWSNRPNCSDCPVLHICRGACMYLDGKYWESTCNNAFSDAIPLFALSIEKITGGYIPSYIVNPHLPLDRQDIWGTFLEHPETPRKKVIPIKVITDKKSVVEGIEVYEKSTIIEGPQC